MESSIEHWGEQLGGLTVTHRFVHLDDVSLHCVEAGSGPLVLLIHGFPDFWYTWRHLLGPLAAAGFRAVAFDTRGANLSSKPSGVAAYHIDHLVADVAALIRALGAKRASLVGHDWGAGIAWAFAMRHPELLERLVILNGPHPECLRRGLRRLSQLQKAWYLFAFQLPWLPEQIVRRSGFAALLAAQPASLSEGDRQRYIEAWQQPGALTATINYYRANFHSGVRPMQRIDAQTFVLWGARDPHLERALAQPRVALVTNCRVEFIEEAGHFVQQDSPDQVARELVRFLRSARGFNASAIDRHDDG